MKQQRCVEGQATGRCFCLSCKQVRHFYYWLLKRLNKILGEERRLDSRNSMQVHQAMLKYGDVAGDAT